MVTPKCSVILPYWCPLEDNTIPNANRRAQDENFNFNFVLQKSSIFLTQDRLLQSMKNMCRAV